MKIRCGKRCGGRRSIIAAKFQPFAPETPVGSHAVIIYYSNGEIIIRKKKETNDVYIILSPRQKTRHEFRNTNERIWVQFNRECN